jgi:Mycothiol maleylpyruvate isomerase N-terminal domain
VYHVVRPTTAFGSYLNSLHLIRPLIHSHEVEVHWGQPSVLEDFTVGSLTAHLLVTVTKVVHVISTVTSPPGPSEQQADVDERTASELMIAARLDDRADVYGPTHLNVRRSATEIAAAGARATAALFDASLQALDGVEVGISEDRLVEVPMPARMPLGEWLSTRLVEVVVHCDDLTESLGLPPVPFGSDITDRVIAVLIAAVRARVGDRAVVIGLARAERSGPDVMRAL